MAVQIAEPRIDKADLNEWASLIERTTAQMGAYISVSIQNGKVLAGSRFEMNGALYACVSDDVIQGFDTGWQNYKNLYVYAQPSGSFIYSDKQPAFKPAHGGWYNGQERAVAFGYKLANAFIATEYIHGMRDTGNLIAVAERGYINVFYSNGKILAHSVYESNGQVRGNIEDRDVSGWSNNWQEADRVYIYETYSSATSPEYYFSAASPARNLQKGAWYNGNNRCLAVGVKVYNQFVLQAYVNNSTVMEPVTGTIYDKAEDWSGTLGPGLYRIILVGGAGGRGGSAACIYLDEYFTAANSESQQGQAQALEFSLDGYEQAYLYCGLNGKDGGNGRLYDQKITTMYWLLGGGGGAGGSRAVFEIPGKNIKFVSSGAAGSGGAGVIYGLNQSHISHATGGGGGMQDGIGPYNGKDGNVNNRNPSNSDFSAVPSKGGTATDGGLGGRFINTIYPNNQVSLGGDGSSGSGGKNGTSAQTLTITGGADYTDDQGRKCYGGGGGAMNGYQLINVSYELGHGGSGYSSKAKSTIYKLGA